MDELTIICGNQRVVLQPGQVATIGRRADSTVVVDDPRVSREHLRLSRSPEGWLMENLGRSGTFVLGKPASRLYLADVVEACLATPDGPVVRFEPAAGSGGTAGTATSPATAAVPAAAPSPTAEAVPRFAAQPVPSDGPRPAGSLRQALGNQELQSALRIVFPIKAWLKDPELRKWYRLAVAVYALIPVVLLAFMAKERNLQTLGWVWSLYVAPLWALVFWYLIRPGRMTRLTTTIAAGMVAAELVLIPVMVLPWEDHVQETHNLFTWILGAGMPEELSKDLPVLVVAYLLYRMQGVKLHPRMWMYMATLSGLMFGVYEASKVYIPLALQEINQGQAGGIILFSERIFVDGFQHAMWSGMAGFFIGLGVNYRRQRVPLWIFGIGIPVLLHGMNDWSTTGAIGSSDVPWLLIQAFSIFLFLGYTASAGAIERDVRHTPLFRGESILLDTSQLDAPPAPGTSPSSSG